MESFFRRTSAFVLLLLVLSIGVTAQTTAGSISGVVTDPSGAVLPGASVAATNSATGLSYNTTTGSDGSFTIPALPLGFYNVKITAKGFSEGALNEVQVSLGQIAKVTVKLAVATTGTEVVVTGEQAAVQTDTVEIKNTIDNRQIMSLPLATRNPLDLVKTMPGTAMAGSDIFMHGLRASTVNLMQDGVNVSDNFVKTSGFFNLVGTTVDNIGEFTVTTSAGGQDSGFGSVQVNQVTASGTNSLHGSAYWYQRTSFLRANPFFNGLTGVKTPFQLQNRAGFQTGGPVYVPHIYNGHNKTFFFLNFEEFREPLQQANGSGGRLVLSDAARTGQFTYTPTCTAATCPAGVTPGVARTINLLNFGTIGNSSATPVINKFVMGPYNTLVPSANGDGCTGDDGTNLRCYAYNAPGKNASNRYVGRLDQNIGTHHTVSFIINSLRTNSYGDFLNNAFKFFPGSGDGSQGGRRQLFSWQLRSNFGQNKTNQAIYAITRAPVNFNRSDDYSAWGGYQLFTSLGNSNFSNPSYVSTGRPQGRNTPVQEASDTFTWVRGHHNLSFGGSYRYVSAVSFVDNAVNNPAVQLGQYSGNPDNLSARVPGGLNATALANAQTVFDYITGLLNLTQRGFNFTSPSSGFVPGAINRVTPNLHNFGFFTTDTWRFRPNLTVTAGLRWEYQGIYNYRNGLMLNVNNTSIQNAIFPISPLFTTSTTPAVNDVTLGFGGATNGKPLYNRDWNNFAPSLGFAWDPKGDGKTAIRAGISTHYTSDGFTAFDNAVTTTGLSTNAVNGLPTGVFDPSNAQMPATPSATLPVSLRNNFGQGTGVSVNQSEFLTDPNLRTPYVVEWNLAIQREIPGRMTLEARYVGNRGDKLYRRTSYNELNLLNSPWTANGSTVANLLTEFTDAQNNLNICTANRVACTGSASGTLTFQNKGLAGQINTPIFDTLFKGLSSGSGYTNTTFVTNLQQNNIFTMYNTLRTNATYFANRQAFPLNFFVANPWVVSNLLLNNGSWSDYNGLEVELRRRFTNGVFFDINYTYAKTLTDQNFVNSQSEGKNYYFLANPKADKGRAPFDIPHSIAANFLYPLPFGRGKMFGTNAGRALEMLIGGFSIQGTANWSNTLGPFSISSGRSTVGSGLTSNAILRNMSISDFKKQMGVFKTPGAVYWLNPASGLFTVTTTTNAAGIPSATSTPVMCTPGQTTPCFDVPAPGQYGNMSFLDFNTPQIFNVDASIIKDVHLTEHSGLEFRLEAFNALNHPNFGGSGGAANSATITGASASQFGRLTSQFDTARGGGATARLVQWAIRVNF